jgi:hypothetical protein
MAKNLSCLSLFLLLISISSAQQFDWTRHDTSSFSFVPAYEHQSLAGGTNGDVYVAWMKHYGLSYNSRLYGTYEINHFDSSGQRSLNISFGPAVSVGSLIVLSNGDLVVSGTFMDTMTVAGVSMFAVNAPGQYIYNSYLLCFDDSGSLKWFRNFSVSHTNVIESCLLATDPSGKLWVSLSDYPNGGYLICMSNSGTDSLQRNWPVELSLISDMKFDAHGSLYLSGALGQDNFNFWTLNVSTNFSYNAFLAKVEPLGNCLWFRSFRDITFDNSYIGLDVDANIYLVKELFDSVTVYGNHVDGPQWVYDFLVVKFDSSGSAHWALDVPDQPAITGDLRLSLSNPIAVTSDGFNLLLGNRGYVDLGNSIIVGTGNPGSNRGLVVLHYNRFGVPQWFLQASTIYGIYPQQITGGNEGGFISAVASGPLQVGLDSISMVNNFTYYSFVTRYSGPLTTGFSWPLIDTDHQPFVNPSHDGNLIMKLIPGKHRFCISDLSGKVRYTSEVYSSGGFTIIPTGLIDGMYSVQQDDLSPFKWMVVH